MKVRKLAVALALAGGLGSGVAQALGLGEIELQSYLNEPMDAEIVLPQSRGVDPGDVFVNIAPERAYQRLGLQRGQFVGKLRFNVETAPDGSLVVNVSSREPLREPYLNFLIELTWPNGRLMREYAVLVDPPVFAEDSGITEQVRAPSVQARQTAPARSAESARRQARVEQSRSSGYSADTFGPTGPADTLWTIASAVRPDNSLSMQQVMLALQDLNPDAFISNNINRLKRGEVLRVPTAEQIRTRTRAEATRAVAQQNQEFQQPKRTLDTTPAQQPVMAGAGEAAAGGDELRLLVAEDEGGRTVGEGGSAGGDGQVVGGVDAGSAVAMEELESARRENDELSTRVDDLQDQVQTLQRLLELKNTQLAEMQQATTAGGAETGAEPVMVDGADSAVADGDSTAPGMEVAVADAAEPGVETGDEEIAGSEGAADEAGAESLTPGDSDPAEMLEAGDGAEVDELASDSLPADEVADSQLAPVAGAGQEQTAKAEEQEAKPQPKPQPSADKGFPGNVIDAITGNTMYQIALGGGLILLLLILLLLARRSASREKAFYEEFNNDPETSDDTFALTLDDEEVTHSEGEVSSDALEEADTYVAYGRYDQAAQVLETAISSEPSRTDLRLKLLSVYADNRDRAAFEKQFGEIRTLGDEEAIAEANELNARLEEAESMPSIDDLESQLRSDTFGEDLDMATGIADSESDKGSETSLSDELLADQYDAGREEQVENEFGDFDSDLADFDLDTLEDATSSDGEGEKEKNLADDLIEYDLSGLELPDTEDKTDDLTEEDTGALEAENDFSSLEIDLDDSFDDLLDESGELASLGSDDQLESGPEGEADTELGADLSDLDSLDESFLDELDAELDKVASETEELVDDVDLEESTLNDLELDVSDEDLALMEEFSESLDSTGDSLEDDEASLEDELSLDDELSLEDAITSEPEESVLEEELPIASEEVADEVAKPSVDEIGEDDLGDDDDFDFLAGTDEAATKLDLARAYIEMGDSDGARDILEEVSLEGDDVQKGEAQDLLKKLS
ncbi:FimV/HubP family polar landmark protein [Marinobacter salexigens]|uniref:FimV/HubP family polar landmark protein n=1 Tax=Marinobacter salexigens TaxID=1925763 RepID=UPI000C295165|nr:FimV/HubP family polar landmark protein [Marinobacter salexigens]